MIQHPKYACTHPRPPIPSHRLASNDRSTSPPPNIQAHTCVFAFVCVCGGHWSHLAYTCACTRKHASTRITGDVHSLRSRDKAHPGCALHLSLCPLVSHFCSSHLFCASSSLLAGVCSLSTQLRHNALHACTRTHTYARTHRACTHTHARTHACVHACTHAGTWKG